MERRSGSCYPLTVVGCHVVACFQLLFRGSRFGESSIPIREPRTEREDSETEAEISRAGNNVTTHHTCLLPPPFTFRLCRVRSLGWRNAR